MQLSSLHKYSQFITICRFYEHAVILIYLEVWWGRTKAAAPSRQKEKVEVVRPLDQDASWAPSFGGFPGTFNWFEAPRWTQNPLERLCISSGLGMPREPPGASWPPRSACCHCDPASDNRPKMDGLMSECKKIYGHPTWRCAGLLSVIPPPSANKCRVKRLLQFTGWIQFH